MTTSNSRLPSGVSPFSLAQHLTRRHGEIAMPQWPPLAVDSSAQDASRDRHAAHCGELVSNGGLTGKSKESSSSPTNWVGFERPLRAEAV